MDPVTLSVLAAVAKNGLAWLATPKNWLYLGAAAVVLVLGVLAFTVHHDDQVIAGDQLKVQAAQGGAIVAAGDQKAAAAAAAVTAQSADQDAQDQATHQENADALRAAPGADAPLDPSLNDVGRRGMCQYGAASGDPGCVQLLKPGPDAPAPAGEVHAAAGR